MSDASLTSLLSSLLTELQKAAELPKAALPKAALPKAALPKAALPKAALPKAALPKAALPRVQACPRTKPHSP